MLKKLREKKAKREFAAFCREREEKRLKELKRLIDKNEREFGDSPFLASVRDFLRENKFLTEKQIARLKDGPPPRSHASRAAGYVGDPDDFDLFEYEYGLCENDFMGGLPF